MLLAKKEKGSDNINLGNVEKLNISLVLELRGNSVISKGFTHFQNIISSLNSLNAGTLILFTAIFHILEYNTHQ